jgi:hypothetical protein
MLVNCSWDGRAALFILFFVAARCSGIILVSIFRSVGLVAFFWLGVIGLVLRFFFGSWVGYVGFV